MLRRISYLLSFAGAFAAGFLVTDIWFRVIGPAPATTQAQIAEPPAPAETAEPAARDRDVGVSIADDAQQAAPDSATTPVPEQARQSPGPEQRQEPAYDRRALDAQIGEVTRDTEPPAETTGAAPVEPPPAAPVATADPPATAPPAQTAALETMIGQMLIFGFQGTKPEQKWPKAVAGQLARGEIGGVIFLKYNLANVSDARRLMDFFHDAGNRSPPPLFVLDQEGGRVQRIGAQLGERKWPSHSAVGRGTIEKARAQYDDMATVVRKWRFNVNLGPVVDVNLNPDNPVIARLGRSFSSDPARVTEFARAFMDAHRDQGILTALKHFPGHGSSRKDSHLGFTDISATWRRDQELAPYRALFASQRIDMVMMGHLYLAQFQGPDSQDRYPATFSRELIEGLLRGKPEQGGLGYDGVVISDDMEMGAIRKHYGTFEAAIRAIKAGIDLLIVSNSAEPQISLPNRYIAEIARAARADPALHARIVDSYGRILDLKKRLAPDAGRVRAGDRS